MKRLIDLGVCNEGFVRIEDIMELFEKSRECIRRWRINGELPRADRVINRRPLWKAGTIRKQFNLTSYPAKSFSSA